jgi:hypothetical protein
MTKYGLSEFLFFCIVLPPFPWHLGNGRDGKDPAPRCTRTGEAREKLFQWADSIAIFRQCNHIEAISEKVILSK